MAEHEQQEHTPLLQRVTQGDILATGGALMTPLAVELLTHNPTGTFIALLIGLGVARHRKDIAGYLIPGQDAAGVVETTARVVDRVQPALSQHGDQSVQAKLKRLFGLKTAPVAQPEPVQENEQLEPMLSLDEPSERRMHLAPDWYPDVEDLVGLGLVCYGIKGAGKSNVGALLAEQFGQYYIPLVIFDKEGDYLSLVDVLPHGYIAGHPSAAAKHDPDTFLAVDMGAAKELGAAILTHGYQVVFDLASYPDDETRARIMALVVTSLMTHADSIPNKDRIPCLVFTDEASHWFPQDRSMSYLPTLIQTDLLRAFVDMANAGRKRGIIPAFFDQRPANFDKRLAAENDIYILMRQRQDVDIARYKKYVGNDLAEQSKTFGNGEGVIITPEAMPFVTRFYKRQSRHISTTPRAEAAMKRFGAPSARALSTQYPSARASDASTPVLMRRHRFTRSSTPSTVVQAPETSTERKITLVPPSDSVQSARDEARFTIEQEAEFVRRYQAEGSMRRAIRAMRLGYGRYQRHASQIVRERNLRRVS